MDDPTPAKRLIELAKKIVDAYFFARRGRDPTHIDEVVEKLREVWKRHQDLRLPQLVFNVSGDPALPRNFYLVDDALLCGLDNFESQEQSGES